MPRQLHPLGDGAAADAAGGDDGPHGARGRLAAGEEGCHVSLVAGTGASLRQVPFGAYCVSAAVGNGHV